MSTMPKKSSRPISVGGRDYRWTVRKTVDRGVLHLVVQDVVTGKTHRQIVRGYEGDPASPVTPATVKRFILTEFAVGEKSL